MKPDSLKITISNRTIVRVLVVVLISFIVVKFIIKVDHALELIFFAFFLSLALNPAIRGIAKWLKIKSRSLATAIAYLFVIVFLTVFIALVVPPLVRQTINFARDIPQTVNNLQHSNSPAGRFVKHYKLESQIHNLSQYLKSHVSNLKEPVISTATKLGDALISALVIFVLTFMMLVEGPEWVDKMSKVKFFADNKWRVDIVRRMYKIITGYVYGQVLLALISGGIALIALVVTSSLLNVSVNSVALAGIVVVTGLVPMVGHVIGGAIVVLACLFVSWPLALIMAIFLLVYQQIENVTIQPYLQAKYNELTPLLVFASALIGIAVGGLLGAFVAIPAAGCLRVAAKGYLKHQRQITAKA
jgi:predicted PurR-regulated permease PerM